MPAPWRKRRKEPVSFKTSLSTSRIDFAALISVAAIMPHAPASGKPRAPVNATGSAGAFSAKRNGPLTDANRRKTCYDILMAKQRKTAAKDSKVGGFVVGRASFAKISAVEGIQLTEAMEKRASDAGRKGLSAEKYRQMIVRSYRKG